MRMYRPKYNATENPLNKLRNIPCPCGSGKKAKKCHGQARYISVEAASKIASWLRVNSHHLKKELAKYAERLK